MSWPGVRRTRSRKSDRYGSSVDPKPGTLPFKGLLNWQRSRLKATLAFRAEHPEEAAKWCCPACGGWKSPAFAYCENCQIKLDLLRHDGLAVKVWGKGSLAKK